MPYENEHACRLRDPSQFQKGSFRRGTRKHNDKEYGVIMGKLKGKTKMTDQAFRYDKKTWSKSEARDHCSDHDGKFEAAKESKTTDDNMERRVFPREDIELRIEDGEKPRLVGYAAKYGSVADLGFFREKIRRGAFDEAIVDADVRCLKNHDPNLILGRTASGTLTLSSNTVGLRFENQVPETNTGKDTLEEIRRGDISGCSFSFTVAEEDWKYSDGDEPPERTILKIRQLFDVGPVTYPAYSDTTVAARSLEAFKTQNNAISDVNISDEGESQARTEQDPASEILDPETQRLYDRKYRTAGRIINRCRPAES